jgi:hypothetical protein
MGIIGAALFGLGEGETLMTGYYAGHLGRVGAFVIAADILMLASIGGLIAALTARQVPARIWLVVISTGGLALTAVLALYGGVAFGVN